jgi:transcriptional regulator with XRE-family HTH domain
MSKTLAEKINWLFETHRDEGGRQFSYGHVARHCRGQITGSYVWKLRMGTMANPGLGPLQALARFFGAPLAYFAAGGEYLERAIGANATQLEPAVERVQLEQCLGNEIGCLTNEHLRAISALVAYLLLQEAGTAESPAHKA